VAFRVAAFFRVVAFLAAGFLRVAAFLAAVFFRPAGLRTATVFFRAAVFLRVALLVRAAALLLLAGIAITFPIVATTAFIPSRRGEVPRKGGKDPDFPLRVPRARRVALIPRQTVAFATKQQRCSPDGA
jgi:hypothetical protein